MTLVDACYRPLICDPTAPNALSLAGGWAAFDRATPLGIASIAEPLAVERLAERDPAALDRLTRPRSDLLGLSLDTPRIMGVLNATPDSFSDGGRHLLAEAAIEAGAAMAAAGADILDVGGESTRPGAETVPEDEELSRVLPVIEGLREAAPNALLSIDTRKPGVARAAFEAGARMFNDVSALTYDAASPETAADLARRFGGVVCVMHAQGEPKTMQDAPRYGDVLLDVCRFLAARMTVAVDVGVPPDRIIVDPGIGFGKTLAHNLTLLRGLSALHCLGVPVLLGASRKRFIGALTGEETASKRTPGSLAAALQGLSQGAQILRVHDVAETVQATRVWMGVATAGAEAAAR